MLELPAGVFEYPQPKAVGTAREDIFHPAIHLKQLKIVDHLKDVRKSTMALEDAVDLTCHDDNDIAGEMTPKLVGRPPTPEIAVASRLGQQHYRPPRI